MSVAERRRQDVESSLGGLTLSTPSQRTAKKAPKQQTSTIADSWEEEASSGSDPESETPRHTIDYPTAPPPTPMSPPSTREGWGDFGSPYSIMRDNSQSISPSRSNPRPEKQTAVAGRLIAGALGVRAPKKTEEQRVYDKAMKEKEIRRREKEKEDRRREVEDAVKAKAAVWDA